MNAKWHDSGDGHIWLVMPDWISLIEGSGNKATKEAIGACCCQHVHDCLGSIHLVMDFEYAIVYGTITDGISLAKKSFGKLLGVSPELEPKKTGNPDFDNRIKYVLTDDNPHVQKQITRNEYKLLLSPGLVKTATNSNFKTDKLGHAAFFPHLTAADREAIEAIGLTPKEFWQNCKNGNIEHVKNAVEDTPKRRQAVKRGRVQYLNNNECNFRQREFDFNPKEQP